MSTWAFHKEKILNYILDTHEFGLTVEDISKKFSLAKWEVIDILEELDCHEDLVEGCVYYNVVGYGPLTLMHEAR